MAPTMDRTLTSNHVPLDTSSPAITHSCGPGGARPGDSTGDSTGDSSLPVLCVVFGGLNR